MPSLAKPCDELKPEDFDDHPLWGGDPSLAESNPDADETWVSPVEIETIDEVVDGFFVRGQLRSEGSTASPLPCLVTLARRMDPKSLELDPHPDVDGLVLWSPGYGYFQFIGEAHLARKDMRKYRPSPTGPRRSRTSRRSSSERRV